MNALFFVFVLATCSSVLLTRADILHDLLDGTSSTNQGPLDPNFPANSQPSTDPNDIQFYMYVAGAAYCQRSATYKDLNCPWCPNIVSQNYRMYKVIQDDTANTLAMIIVNDQLPTKTAIVAIPGTYNLENVLQDVNIPMVSIGDPNIKVHQGYLDATNSIYPQILSNLTDLTTNQGYTKVVVTGHSLGGAMTALTGFFLSHDLPNVVIELFTYGQPRVGNVNWANYMNGLSMIISGTVNKADVVPHSVPAALGYYHHLSEHWIKTTGTYEGDRTYYEDPAGSASVSPIQYRLSHHATYLGVNVLTCAALDPASFISQSIGILKPLFPSYLSPLINTLLLPISTLIF